MNALLSMPAFAVVSSEAKQTARTEVALRTGPAEPERRSDVGDDSNKEKKDEWEERLRIHWEWAVEEMTEREALGVGCGDDKTPPLTAAELAEVAILVERIKVYADHVASRLMFATNWREAKPFLGYRYPPGDQSSSPSEAREHLEKLRNANAILRVNRSNDDAVKHALVGTILHRAESHVQRPYPNRPGDILAVEHPAFQKMMELGTSLLASRYPQVASLKTDPEARRLYAETISELFGRKALRKRHPGSTHVARWIETAWLLAVRLNLVSGELRAWSSWAEREGFDERGARIVALYKQSIAKSTPAKTTAKPKEKPARRK